MGSSRSRPLTTPAGVDGAATLWVFDLDGTLIGSIRSDVLRPGAVALLDALAQRGASCALWSAGGVEYARRMAEQHAIADRFVAFASKSGRDRNGRYRSPSFETTSPPHRRVYIDDVPADTPDDGVSVGVRQFMGGNPADTALSEVAARMGLLLAEDPGARS